MPTLTLDQDIQTAIVPELPTIGAYGPLSTNDKMIVYLTGPGVTCQAALVDLYTFFSGGGGGGGGTSFQLAVIGDKLPYQISTLEAGVDTLNIPDLAGKTFYLERGGFPLLLNEYEILSGGGFKLKKAGDKLVEGERFLLTIYELQGGSSVGNNSAALLIKGSVSISTNQTYDVVNHLNKLIQLRGGSTQLQYTLAQVDDIPDNTIVILETMIGNTVEHKIQTQAGQLIYMNNTSYSALYMRPGEVLMLYRADDGYYVISDRFAEAYRQIGANPQPSFKPAINELNCNGQLVSKTAYKRLLETVQTFGASFISKSTYDSDPAAYKAYWVDWDSTNLRLPDLGELFIRGINTGNAGRFQDEAINIATNVKGVKNTGSNTIASTVDSLNSTGQEFDLTHNFAISDKQGTETRPVNAGFPFVVKC